MNLVRITGQHAYLAPIRSWYETAFPPEERRPFDALVRLLPHPDMHLYALVQAGQPVGFVIYWRCITLNFRSKLIGKPMLLEHR